MRQGDRAIDWSRDKTETIVTKINAADSAPGVLDHSSAPPDYLYGAHYEDRLKGQAWRVLASVTARFARDKGRRGLDHPYEAQGSPRCEESGLRGRRSRPRLRHCTLEICPAAEIKIPATIALGRCAANAPKSALPIEAKPDYRTFQEIR